MAGSSLLSQIAALQVQLDSLQSLLKAQNGQTEEPVAVIDVDVAAIKISDASETAFDEERLCLEEYKRYGRQMILDGFGLAGTSRLLHTYDEIKLM